MNDFVEKLFSRLSKYEWLTQFVPGLFLFALLKKMRVHITSGTVIEDTVLVLFLGVVCARIGALFEPIAQKMKLIGRYNYGEYLDWQAKHEDDASRLLRNSNWYRSLCGMMLALGGAFLLNSIPAEKLSGCGKSVIIMCLLFAIFVVSYRRQVHFISERIKIFEKEKGNEVNQVGKTGAQTP